MYTNFVVSSITDDDAIADKIDTHNVQLMEQLLNTRLRLSDYGTGVSGIAVVFLGTAPEADVIHEEEIRFKGASGEVYLQLRLPYPELAQATEAEVLDMMVLRYVDGLRDLADGALLKGFEWVRLQQDVEVVLGGMANKE